MGITATVSLKTPFGIIRKLANEFRGRIDSNIHNHHYHMLF